MVTTASAHGEDAFSIYEPIFERLGESRVTPFNLDSRKEAQDERLAGQLPRLSGIFFSGGDQLRITSTLGGSRFHRELMAAHHEGLVVAGTSAGASMISHTMVVEGDARESPTRNTVRMATGMGLWAGAVIDQHFSQRGRIGRLLSALAQNPEILGVGLDENTAIEVSLERGQLEVLGANTVTILDGREIDETNASESAPDQPLALTGVRLHVLPKGYGFELSRRRPYQVRERQGSVPQGKGG